MIWGAVGARANRVSLPYLLFSMNNAILPIIFVPFMFFQQIFWEFRELSLILSGPRGLEHPHRNQIRLAVNKLLATDLNQILF